MTKRKTTRKPKQKVPKNLKEFIFTFLKRKPKKRYNARQLKHELKLAVSVDAIRSRLEQLKQENRIIKASNEKYKYNPGAQQNKVYTVEGIVDMTRQGSAYIICDDLEEDIFVSSKSLNKAFHKDVVLVRYSKGPRSKKPKGKVIKVIKRAQDRLLATFGKSRKRAFATSEDVRMSMDIQIPLDATKGAKTGDRVLVKITDWHEGEQENPSGEVLYVLGHAGEHEVEMQSILVKHGFDLEFPPEVLAETQAIRPGFTKREIAKRRDFREISTFTIDPKDAKDFDDALSIQYLENGFCEVGVHIADVTYYIKPGTALDKEAYLRSTSVYLVDRVAPMLPERLSNGLCSLKEGEDRFCFSAVFTFDKNDKIVDRWFGKTIIHSNRRMSYEQAQEALDTGKGDFADELRVLNRLAYKLRKVKFKKGAISFEASEVKFELDEAGVPIEAYTLKRGDSHLLIEDFMLLANREVATKIATYKEGTVIPFVYRVHDKPDPEKIADFALFAAEIGFPLRVDTPQQIVESFTLLSQATEEREELELLMPLAIRTMAKAEYSPENIGHYGLAFSNYTHFTSPIRRYSDVLVHRIFARNLNKVYRADLEELKKQCRHISNQERKALEAERASKKYKQVEFMTAHVGEVFDGIISGFIDRGIFVELTENKCEGLIDFSRLNQVYHLEGSYKAVGKQDGNVFKLGQKIQAKILSADMTKLQIDMTLAE